MRFDWKKQIIFVHKTPNILQLTLVSYKACSENKGCRFESTTSFVQKWTLRSNHPPNVLRPVKRVEVVERNYKNSFPFPLESSDSWTFVKENPDRKKELILVESLLMKKYTIYFFLLIIDRVNLFEFCCDFSRVVIKSWNCYRQYIDTNY